MRYFLILFVSLLIVGVGCLSRTQFTDTHTPPSNEEGTPESVTDLVGVIAGIQDDTHTVDLQLVDGTPEEIVFGDMPDITVQDIGLLLTVSGTRDPVSQAIDATTWAVMDTPDLFVVTPSFGATVTSPLLVQGFGRVFEQAFNWRIKDGAGETVLAGSGMTAASDIGSYGPFRLEIFLPAMSTNTFTLEVYEASAQDGSETNLVSVPLKLLTTHTSAFSVYFSNSKKGSSEDCERVFPVERTVAETSAVGRVSLMELLQGPTEEEKAEGYFSSIPENAELQSLVIAGGVATADFTQAMNQVAGSCRVTAIRSEITQTLRQFPTVSHVTISVDENSETALQP